MSFRFSLQRILDLRSLEVEEAQKQLNNTKGIIAKLKNILEQERDHYFSDREALNSAVKNTEFTEIKIYENSLTIHQSKMMELLKNLRDLQQELKGQEENLMRAKLNKKVIEKLYTIKENEYTKKMQMQEQFLLDEMANQKFIKNGVAFANSYEDHNDDSE